MKRIRTATSFTIGVLVAAGIMYSLPWLLGVASAAADPVAAVTTATTDQLGWMAYIGIALAAAGGVLKILDVLLVALKWEAPLTKTKVDDALRDDVQLVHDKLDALTQLVGGIVPAQAQAKPVVQNAVTIPPRDKQLGQVSLYVMLATAAIGALALVACASGQREDTIKAALVTVDSARDGFLAYDRAHEMSMVAHCDPTAETKEQCQAKVNTSNAALAAYQAKRAKVDPLFTAAYRWLAAAKILNDDQSLSGMQSAIAQLLASLQPFLGGK